VSALLLAALGGVFDIEAERLTQEIARSATILCMSARNAVRAAAPLCWTAAPASAKAVLSWATGSAAPLTACFSVLSADIAPPISAPNLICTSSANCHLK
jgi:hypothetical protein